MNWEDILWELVQMIESAAPKAWDIALKQVYVSLYKSLFASLMIVIAGISGMVYCHKQRESEAKLGVFILMLFALVLFLSDTIGYWINPEYYAIKSLVNLVGGLQ